MYINTEEFLDEINKELNVINKSIGMQRQKKTIVFEGYNIIIMNSLRTHLKEWEDLLSEATNISKYIDENMNYLEKLQKNLTDISDLIMDIQYKKSKNESYEDILEDIKNKHIEFLSEKEKSIELLFDNTFQIEEFNKKVISSIKKCIYEEDMFKPIPSILKKENIKKEIIENEIELKVEEQESKDNKVLTISEKDNKVYLPYLIVDLERELKEKKQYNNIEELIQNEYILNLDKFKNSMIARFKEAYKLIKKKEKKSIIDATELGLELMFNYSLNPAIIAACKNEDELDIYLDCLEENELDSFKIFDVKYEVSPTINISGKSKH